jgi:hypothetical protein
MGRQQQTAAVLFSAALLGILGAAPSTASAVEAPELIATSTSLVLVPPMPRADTGIHVTATVTGDSAGEVPQGGVDFFIDGEIQGLAVVLEDGVASVTLSEEAPGAHTVQATFNEQNGFASSTATLAVNVDPTPGGNTGPARPQLPRSVEAPAAPADENDDPPAPAPVAAPAPAPTELPFTGAMAVPGLLTGLASIGLGLGCRRYSRRG